MKIENSFLLILLSLFLLLPTAFAHEDENFFDTFFIHPLVEGTGYNVVNTATFAIILIAAAFGVYKLLKKLQIKIDRNFLIGVIPFVALGGILRAFEDFSEASGTARNFFFVSPLIYVTIFVIAFVLLLVSTTAEKLSKKKIGYYKIWFALGAIIDIFFLAQFRFANAFAFFMVLIITVIWVVLFVVAKIIAKNKFSKLNKFLTAENMFIILVHLFDAATTFVALQYLGYFEQHVLPGFLIGLLGTWAMFLLKIIVVPIVMYFFDREMKNEKEMEKRTFLKLVVLILGLGPGLRNWLRMIGGF
ncbi:MAG: DUF63 family protein [Candidatus Aenigmarchaeota archaeon]|nr:DUF63 family protein [Candidatus Aenigmarchaeota archaeon]